MDRETVLRLAKAAGMCGMATTVVCEISELERFAAAVAAAVNEEDARLCDRFAAREMHPAECAAAIRASIKEVK